MLEIALASPFLLGGKSCVLETLSLLERHFALGLLQIKGLPLTLALLHGREELREISCDDVEGLNVSFQHIGFRGSDVLGSGGQGNGDGLFDLVGCVIDVSDTGVDLHVDLHVHVHRGGISRPS